jgi:hypothetical protein
VHEFPQKRRAALADSPAGFADALCRRLVHDRGHRAWQWEKLSALRRSASGPDRARAMAHLQKLRRWGLLTDGDELRPLRPGTAPAAADWTALERAQLDALHAELLADLVVPGLRATNQVNYVDPRLSAPRVWRDIYRYDRAGRWLGWTRYSVDGRQDFNSEGLLVLESDTQGRCVRGQVVRYELGLSAGFAPNSDHTLRLVRGEAAYRFTFSGDDDLRGQRAAGQAP